MESLAEGTVVAERYLLVRKRGSGGVGSVWLARDLSLDSLCAIKLIDGGGGRANQDELRVRLEREAKSAAQIRCSNVVDVFEHGIWNGIPFIVMEFLEGEDLGERLARTRRLGPDETYRIVAQVARALVRAHALGIVHRDLKPDNVFLVPGDEHEVAKVLDFGIARHEAYSIDTKATKTGTFVGTPCYVSPEQARGKDIDWRSDLWALAIMVFECLTGRPPFVSEGLGELMGMILYEPIPSLVATNPEFPDALEAWWRCAAAREPDQRFQSAKEFADALGQALGIEVRLAIPDIPPLGLGTRASARSRSPLPFATPIGSVALVRGAAAASRSGHDLGNAYSSVRPRRPRFKHEQWLLPAGTAAVFAVVAISAFSAARAPEPLRPVPALLHVSPAVSAPAPRAGAPVHAQTTLAPQVTPVTATLTDAAPTSEPTSRVRARPPASPRSNREKPEPGIRQSPRRSSEHDAGRQGPTLNDDTLPDYGI